MSKSRKRRAITYLAVVIGVAFAVGAALTVAADGGTAFT